MNQLLNLPLLYIHYQTLLYIRTKNNANGIVFGDSPNDMMRDEITTGGSVREFDGRMPIRGWDGSSYRRPATPCFTLSLIHSGERGAATNLSRVCGVI